MEELIKGHPIEIPPLSPNAKARKRFALKAEMVSSEKPSDAQVYSYSASEGKMVPTTNPAGVTDHGALTGLTDDDHTIYRLESADHNHTTTGLQGGQLTVAALSDAPAGELGGTWASPTVDATHSGSAHHDAVTLAGTPDYITISGQVITRAQIDLTTDVTGDLPIAEGGTGQSTAQAAIDALTAVAGATNEHVLTKDTATGNAVFKAAASGGVTDADYLVGTAHAGLSAEIVVGTTPGGELGGTWASPTVDATHSGSAHHAAVTASGAHTMSGQDITAVASSITLAGHIEIATAGEVITGASTALALVPGTVAPVVQNARWTFAADAEASDAYAITLTPAISSYFTGMMLTFTANTANTGACSLDVNTLGAVTIKKNHDADLADGDIEAGAVVVVVYDGTNFQMISQLGNAAAGGGDVATDAIWDAAGDLAVGSGADTAVALTTGAAGTVLIGGTTWSSSPVIGTALILGAATTSGIRLDLESGVMAVREGDDSAYASAVMATLGLSVSPSTTIPLSIAGALTGSAIEITTTASGTGVQVSASRTGSYTALNLGPTVTLNANSQSFKGLSSGVGPNTTTTGLTGLIADALAFTIPATVQASSATVSSTYARIAAVNASPKATAVGTGATGVGTNNVTEMYGFLTGLQLLTTTAAGGTATVTVTDGYGIRIQAPTQSGAGTETLTNYYGTYIEDTTGIVPGTDNYLLEIGGTIPTGGAVEPSLRVIGGGAPGAGVTNIYASVAGTLRRLQIKDGAAIGAGDNVAVFV